VRHPLKLAVTGLWTLGGLYLSLGAFGSAFLLLQQGGVGSVGTDIVAVLLVAPGILYMLGGSAVSRGRLLLATAVVNAVVTLVLVLLLLVLAQRVGWIDLVLRPRNVGHRHVGPAILMLLIAYHARLVVHLLRAREAGDTYPLESRGFEAAPAPVARETSASYDTQRPVLRALPISPEPPALILDPPPPEATR
jgi:hypothetical protein